MGLDSILRKGLRSIDKVTKTLQVNVQHFRWIRQVEGVDQEYAAPITHRAIVDDNPDLKYTRSGVVIPVRARIIIPRPFAPLGVAGRQEPVDMRDYFKLPDGSAAFVLELPGVLDPTTSRQYFADVLVGNPENRRTIV